MGELSELLGGSALFITSLATLLVSIRNTKKATKAAAKTAEIKNIVNGRYSAQAYRIQQLSDVLKVNGLAVPPLEATPMHPIYSGEWTQ